MAKNQPFSGWYVGIASDPEDTLFNRHRVKEWYIYRNAGTEASARDTEKALIADFGTQGDTGGGDSTTVYVYTYKITSTTSQD